MHISVPWGVYRYYRSRLKPWAQAVYDAIVKGLQDWQKDIPVPTGDRDVATRIYRLVLLDIPAFFHVDFALSLPCFGQMVVYPNYVMTEAEYQAQFQKVSAFLQRAQALCSKPEQSDFDKLRGLHDAVIRHVIYHDSDSDNEHNVLGAIVDRKAVCESIAKAYKLMCDAVGVPSVVIFGEADGHSGDGVGSARSDWGGHAWNAVRLEGTWYLADVTFDLSLTGGGDQPYYHYDYFLRSRDLFSIDHCPDASYPTIPCLADYGLYRRMGRSVANPKELKALIQKIWKAGDRVLIFEADPSWQISYDQLRRLLVEATPFFSGASSLCTSMNQVSRVVSVEWQ